MGLKLTFDGETGDLIESVTIPDRAPDVVSARQIKLALLGAALLDQVEAFVAKQDRGVQISWEYATEFRRDDPMLDAMAQAFGMSSDQIDGLFLAAIGF